MICIAFSVSISIDLAALFRGIGQRCVTLTYAMFFVHHLNGKHYEQG